MSSAATSHRRQRGRTRSSNTKILRLCVDDSGGKLRWLTADLIDWGGGGLGVSVAFPLAVGSTLSVNGNMEGVAGPDSMSRKARVCWCLEKDDGTYRAGLAFDDQEATREETWEHHATAADVDEDDDDHYEVLQLSPGAHPDTVQRVYRMLAQRYHPDNTETGDENLFKKVLEAYRVLKGSETRAAYDARRQTTQKARWRVFQTAAESEGIEGEKRKRQSILSLLYARRMNEPDGPTLTIHALEDLLGCPRDHLEVSLWYLREKQFIRRNDRGRYEITVEGVDEAELLGSKPPATHPMLTAGPAAG